MWMTKTEAHQILDQAKIDHLVPYNLICKALAATGDLQGLNRTTDGTLRQYGNESVYVRTRSMDGQEAAR